MASSGSGGSSTSEPTSYVTSSSLATDTIAYFYRLARRGGTGSTSRTALWSTFTGQQRLSEPGDRAEDWIAASSGGTRVSLVGWRA
jgi:hypothetical protein